MPLTQTPPKVVAGVAQKHPYAIMSGDRSQITVMACGSASGCSILPLVILNSKHLQLEMTMGEGPGTFCGLSDSGWMNAELFQEWFQNWSMLRSVDLCSFYWMGTPPTIIWAPYAWLQMRELFCSVHHPSTPAPRLWDIFLIKRRLHAIVPAVLHKEPWKCHDTAKLYGDFSTSLGKGDGNV